ncbi:hypothetical protein NMY22_g5905 [Coprinellus aureogranulatus]|nr:hypothetical protein NMY22_g5905 [Coprinellus aureogranulatus]
MDNSFDHELLKLLQPLPPLLEAVEDEPALPTLPALVPAPVPVPTPPASHSASPDPIMMPEVPVAAATRKQWITEASWSGHTPLTLHKSKSLSGYADERQRQGLGEAVRRLLSARNLQGLNGASLNHISQPEEPQIKVLHASKVLWVLAYTDSRVVVNVERGAPSA